MQKKYQVFISSTFRDLQEERQDAIRSVLDLGHIPAGMELFPASDTEQLSYIKKIIDECDYYVLIMGGRYGSLDSEGVSFTEREYDYAVEQGKTVLAFVHGDASNLTVAKSDTAPRLLQALTEFREKVMKGRLVREWATRESLEPLVVKALVRAFSDYPATGWVRGDTLATTETVQQNNDLLVENAKLKSELGKLSASFHPKIDNIAGLDDLYELNYSYTYYPGTRYQGSESRKGKKSLKWREIFVAAGPTLKAPVQPDVLHLAINNHLSQNLNTGSNTNVLKSDVETVEGHLIALGFVESHNAKSVNGGVRSFINLTDIGRTRLIELQAIRRSTTD